MSECQLLKSRNSRILWSRSSSSRHLSVNSKPRPSTAHSALLRTEGDVSFKRLSIVAVTVPFHRWENGGSVIVMNTSPDSKSLLL